MSNAYSLAIVKYILDNLYTNMSHDVLFYESINFNKETIISKLDFGSRQMVLNHEPKMEDEKILQ